MASQGAIRLEKKGEIAIKHNFNYIRFTTGLVFVKFLDKKNDKYNLNTLLLSVFVSSKW